MAELENVETSEEEAPVEKEKCEKCGATLGEGEESEDSSEEEEEETETEA